ncbi:MAG: cell division protein SepF [Clostridiales Family XIII bacterium]|nr:cell division protein SepF [Clostridiales Family XIII bacterium]
MGFFQRISDMISPPEDDYVEEEDNRTVYERTREERQTRFSNPKKYSTDEYLGSVSKITPSKHFKSSNEESSATSKTPFNIIPDTNYSVIIVSPKDFSETPLFVEKLKNKQPVILNIESIETEKARKIFDFLSGAIYALDGTVKKIANDIYMFSPKNVKIYMHENNLSKPTLN